MLHMLMGDVGAGREDHKIIQVLQPNDVTDVLSVIYLISWLHRCVYITRCFLHHSPPVAQKGDPVAERALRLSGLDAGAAGAVAEELRRTPLWLSSSVQVCAMSLFLSEKRMKR